MGYQLDSFLHFVTQMFTNLFYFIRAKLLAHCVNLHLSPNNFIFEFPCIISL